MSKLQFNSHPIQFPIFTLDQLSQTAVGDAKKQDRPINKLFKKSTPAIADGMLLNEEKRKYLLPHFTCLVVGKPGSGKSYMVKKLITEERFYKGEFDYLVLISPSIRKLGIKTPKEFCNTIYSIDFIHSIIQKINCTQIERMEKILREEKRVIDGKTAMPTSLMSTAYTIKQTNNPNNVSLGQDLVHKENKQALSQPYRVFNQKQRFFTIETLQTMKKGGNVLEYQLKQAKAFTNNQSQYVKKRVDKYEDKQKALKQQAEFLYGKYSDVDEIEEKLVSQLSEDQKLKTRVNLIVVLDDVVGDIKANENNPLQTQLFFNRRHLLANGCMSLFLITQKYTLVPSRIRSNANQMILFRLNPVDFENVFKDVILIQHDKWHSLIKRIYGLDQDTENKQLDKKRYDHLNLWVEYDVFFKDFERLFLHSIESQQDTPSLQSPSPIPAQQSCISSEQLAQATQQSKSKRKYVKKAMKANS